MGTNDPIGRMFKRGQLRRKTDRDGKAARARLKAARMWQSIYADLPGAQLNSDKRKAAQAMSRLQDQLGEYRSLLLRRVLGEKLELDAVASLMLGIAVPADPITAATLPIVTSKPAIRVCVPWRRYSNSHRSTLPGFIGNPGAMRSSARMPVISSMRLCDGARRRRLQPGKPHRYRRI